MAFGIQYISRCEQTQQFDKTYNSATGNTTAQCTAIFTYNGAAVGGSNDSNAAIQTVGFFNGMNGYFNVGDWILINSNDPAFHILNVTTIAAGVVTTTQLV